MDYAVTISILVQIGPDDYEMRKLTKIINSLTTIGEIELWIKREDKSLHFADASISLVSK